MGIDGAHRESFNSRGRGPGKDPGCHDQGPDRLEAEQAYRLEDTFHMSWQPEKGRVDDLEQLGGNSHVFRDYLCH